MRGRSESPDFLLQQSEPDQSFPQPPVSMRQVAGDTALACKDTLPFFRLSGCAVFTGAAAEGAEGPEPYALVIRRQKAHERIVWGVSWAPGGSGAFATCSRDRLVKLWSADAIVAAAGAQVLRAAFFTEGWLSGSSPPRKPPSDCRDARR